MFRASYSIPAPSRISAAFSAPLLAFFISHSSSDFCLLSIKYLSQYILSPTRVLHSIRLVKLRSIYLLVSLFVRSQYRLAVIGVSRISNNHFSPDSLSVCETQLDLLRTVEVAS